MFYLFSTLFKYILQMLGQLISVVKQHIRNYLDEIFTLIRVS